MEENAKFEVTGDCAARVLAVLNVSFTKMEQDLYRVKDTPLSVEVPMLRIIERDGEAVAVIRIPQHAFRGFTLLAENFHPENPAFEVKDDWAAVAALLQHLKEPILRAVREFCPAVQDVVPECGILAPAN